MIIRSIVFYSSDLTKNIAINIAKGLKGYVDVENYSLKNEHIDYDPFHNIIFVLENINEDFLNAIKKYSLQFYFKNNYICFLSEKEMPIKYSNKFIVIKEMDPKKLVNESIKVINDYHV